MFLFLPFFSRSCWDLAILRSIRLKKLHKLPSTTIDSTSMKSAIHWTSPAKCCWKGERKTLSRLIRKSRRDWRHWRLRDCTSTLTKLKLLSIIWVPLREERGLLSLGLVDSHLSKRSTTLFTTFSRKTKKLLLLGQELKLRRPERKLCPISNNPTERNSIISTSACILLPLLKNLYFCQSKTSWKETFPP